MKLESVDLPPNILHRWRHTVYLEHAKDPIVCSSCKKEEPLPSEVEEGQSRLVHVWKIIK